MHHTRVQLDAHTRTFSQLLSSTRRGARLARLIGTAELRSWDVPFELYARAESVIAELAANAAFHGRVPGRSFRLTLRFTPPAGPLRIEVTDARGDLQPRPRPTPADTDEPASTGRGLALVTALTDHWDTVPHPPGGKTVRATLTLLT
ncbi:ATP-binding protein [Streptomyces sp. XM4193]|uniref:ATP-binding protein n=1 Tax=Streptomyces sp. XM4193 TaxID=2929782 RepID=UPI001FF9ED4E|nr:ATP-binding protein [Streptomyces sp. XM4193]MCK1795656.1 ATP-binding protein [Streptomyces sp. XM4193]